MVGPGGLGETGWVTEVPNILATRYASPQMSELWSAEHKVRMERELWIAVMRAQHDLGIDVPIDAIDSYEAVIDQVDLESIRQRENVTRHDVKARLEEFSSLAGHEHAHKGMTSRDLTENVEQLKCVVDSRSSSPAPSPHWPGWRSWLRSTTRR